MRESIPPCTARSPARTTLRVDSTAPRPAVECVVGVVVGSGRIVSARRGVALLPRGVGERLRWGLTDARRFLDVRGLCQGGWT